jgi:protein-L-isoaspartate O-methyltransferase
MPLTPRARETLTSVKWTEEYRFDVDTLEDRLRALGRALVPAAREFLSRYGGLHCYQPSPYQPGLHAWHTDSDEAAVRLTAQQLEALEREAGSRVTPIGESGYGYWTMAMDETGAVYAIDQHSTVMEWAESGEALFDLLTCRPLTEPAYGSKRHVREWRARLGLD